MAETDMETTLSRYSVEEVHFLTEPLVTHLLTHFSGYAVHPAGSGIPQEAQRTELRSQMDVVEDVEDESSGINDPEVSGTGVRTTDSQLDQSSEVLAHRRLPSR